MPSHFIRTRPSFVDPGWVAQMRDLGEVWGVDNTQRNQIAEVLTDGRSDGVAILQPGEEPRYEMMLTEFALGREGRQ